MEERIRGAQLIVLSIGRTQALGWEVERLKQLGALERTVFVIPPVETQDIRARLTILAGMLDIDPGLLDHQAVGMEVLAVVVPNGRHPALIVSGVRDDVSYDLAMRNAAGALIGEVEIGPPEHADLTEAPRLPKPLIHAPGALPKRRRWYRRPGALALALLLLTWFVRWAAGDETPTDRTDVFIDLTSTVRFFLPHDERDKVIVVQNAGDDVVVTEVDARAARAHRIATLRASPQQGASAGEWIVVTDSVGDTVSAVNRRSGKTWTRRVAGAPRGVSLGTRSAAIALTEGDAIAEIRLRDGAVLRRSPLAGAPFDVSSSPEAPLVSLAAADRVVQLDAAHRPVRSVRVPRPRRILETGSGPWVVSADTGTLRPLTGAGALTTGDFLPASRAQRRSSAARHSTTTASPSSMRERASDAAVSCCRGRSSSSR